MKRTKAKSIAPISGWLLIAREEIDEGKRTGDWYIAWDMQFHTKKSALSFAGLNNWPRPYRAVRGQITVQP